MGDNKRAGRPLRKSSDAFSLRVPFAMRVFYAELNNLVDRAGLSYRQIVDDTPGLELTDGERGRQTGESPRGPSDKFFDAVMCQTAIKLNEQVGELTEKYSALLSWARQSGEGAPPSQPSSTENGPELPGNSQEPTEKGSAVMETPGVAENPVASESVDQNGLATKSAWLLGLMSDGEEAVAAEHLAEEFGGDKALLSAALVEVGQRLPGAVASLLNVVRDHEGLPRSTVLFEAIKALDSDTASKIAKVPLQAGAVTAAWNPTGILELDPMLLFGRRVIKLTQRGTVELACREIVAEIRAPRGNVLGSIIDASEGSPSVVNTLLTALSKSHPEEFVQCVLELIRRSRFPQDRSRLLAFDDALSEELREMLLRSLSHTNRIPNTHDTHDTRNFSEGFSDLVGLVAILRVTPHRLAKAMAAEKTVTAEGLSAASLLEAVTEFQAILEHMASDRLDHTVVLLARALAEWDLRLGIPGGAVEQYRPVKNLAEMVLGSAFAYQLIRRMIQTYPSSGTLLFHAMQWLDDPRFPPLVTSLTATEVTLADLIDALVAISKDLRRQMVFEKLISHAPERIDTIIESVNTKYPHMNLALPAPPGETIHSWAVVDPRPPIAPELPELSEQPERTTTEAVPAPAPQSPRIADSVTDTGETATAQMTPESSWPTIVQWQPVSWQPPPASQNDDAQTVPIEPATAQSVPIQQDPPSAARPNGPREVPSPPWLQDPAATVVPHPGDLRAKSETEKLSSAPRFAAFGRIRKTPSQPPAETHKSAREPAEEPADEIFGDPTTVIGPVLDQ
ncbi:hypothetical protein [Nocardia asteroides]|uniref:hypothetical protein n=1 Tax=Nocardia asteroides TaxID=1824 RepID=UPI00343320BB